MNVYDFDGTIYKGDSPTDFYFYLLKEKKHAAVLKYFPQFLIDVWKYGTKSIDKTKLKETFYRYLNCFKEGEIDNLVKEFWDKKGGYNIFDWYKKQKKDDDVIVSASPRWLLTYEVCGKLGIKTLICSEMDKRNGDYIGINCYGPEKVARFFKSFPDATIDEFYSDSYSDEPLARYAKKAYLVDKNGNLSEWKEIWGRGCIFPTHFRQN